MVWQHCHNGVVGQSLAGTHLFAVARFVLDRDLQNEAFATLMGEIIIINELHPEWRIHSEFINAHLKRALQLDSLRSSHPIEMPCPGKLRVSRQ